jgi:hypothetical protein
VCDLETSRIGAPYIYDISILRVNDIKPLDEDYKFQTQEKQGSFVFFPGRILKYETIFNTFYF